LKRGATKPLPTEIDFYLSKLLAQGKRDFNKESDKDNKV